MRMSGTSLPPQNRPVRIELAKPVFFVGFMGAGKTSVARKLARTCGIASVDMDTYLERREGKRVRELFAEAGEEAFRAIETDVLRELAGKDPLLVSCCGRRTVPSWPSGDMWCTCRSQPMRRLRASATCPRAPCFATSRRPVRPSRRAFRCTRTWPMPW